MGQRHNDSAERARRMQKRDSNKQKIKISAVTTLSFKPFGSSIMKYFTSIKNDALEYLLKWEKAHGLE